MFARRRTVSIGSRILLRLFSESTKQQHVSDLKQAGYEKCQSLFKKSDVVNELNKQAGSNLKKNLNHVGGYDDDFENMVMRLERKEEKRVKKEKRQQEDEDKQMLTFNQVPP